MLYLSMFDLAAVAWFFVCWIGNHARLPPTLDAQPRSTRTTHDRHHDSIKLTERSRVFRFHITTTGRWTGNGTWIHRHSD